MKKIYVYVAAAGLLITVACGPPGPALGLGPAFDPPIGLVPLFALLFGAAWAAKSAVHSREGPASERHMSNTGRSFRDWLFSGEHRRSPSTTRELVKERYARGEIDRTQYVQMLKDLDESR